MPVGTRSIGYFTKLLKPTFGTNNFEESFSTWEFELNRYEKDNNTQLPDQVKIAVLMNETKGPLQQHLHLMAGATPTYPTSDQQSWNIAGQPEHSTGSSRAHHPVWQQTTMEELHRWT